jgi:hypothetical protein
VAEQPRWKEVYTPISEGNWLLKIELLYFMENHLQEKHPSTGATCPNRLIMVGFFTYEMKFFYFKEKN